ncbi:hypothetical protein BGZ61DRAFT_459654 [Ilyonectria robusta]|uniref:uncharacterized protein n=1 Tax=Ilyonectria robusta TaxID=1079257 RepID=UPI001E8E38C8|nr:uncharacterized protein BGZ61DRAFT_459654 [Ilyonectria robusta]KAH8670602.1 hypothetical protein BGZ61DRAFT_459654 [Ilyonectria robusta]
MDEELMLIFMVNLAPPKSQLQIREEKLKRDQDALFKLVVNNIANKLLPGARLDSEAIATLRESADDFLWRLFASAKMVAEDNGHTDLMPGDVDCVWRVLHNLGVYR